MSTAGLTFWDVAVELNDGRMEGACLGAEAVRKASSPETGCAAMMIIGLERERLDPATG